MDEILVPRHLPKRDWRLLIAMAIALFSLTLVLGVAVVMRAQAAGREQIRELKAERAAALAGQECRGRFALSLIDAQVTFQVAFGDLLVAVAAKTESKDLIEAVAEADKNLRARRNAQAAYFTHPTTHCPIGG